MRNLVQPPPSLHCDHCNGELRLKLIEPANSVFDLDAEIFVCAKCGHEQSYVVQHDHYSTPPRARRGSAIRWAPAVWSGPVSQIAIRHPRRMARRCHTNRRP